LARILLIEDDEISRVALARILESAGHTVVAAEDGVKGMALYRQRPTDLIITDIMMPVKDGMHVINELRRDFPDAKIIAISGSDEEERREFFFDVSRILGAKRTFQKPLDIPELLAVVGELLA